MEIDIFRSDSYLKFKGTMIKKNPWENAHACLKELVDELPGSITISANRGTDEEVSKY